MCSAEEFWMWVAEYRRQPWGDEWRQTATVAYWSGNSGRMKKMTKPGDLIPSQKKKFITDPRKFEQIFRVMDKAHGR